MKNFTPEYEQIKTLYRQSVKAAFAIGGIIDVLVNHNVAAADLRLNLPFSRSTGYNMRRAYLAVEEGYIDKGAALQLGYLKCACLYVEKTHNMEVEQPPLGMAIKMTVREYRRFLQGYPARAEKMETFPDLTKHDKQRLRAVLEHYGAVRRGKGLQNKSKALMLMVQDLENIGKVGQTLGGVPPKK